jgi:hypothetical protein
MNDFDKNIEAVEQDLTGDIASIISKLLEWKHLNSSSKSSENNIDHGKNVFSIYLKGESNAETRVLWCY